MRAVTPLSMDCADGAVGVDGVDGVVSADRGDVFPGATVAIRSGRNP